MSWGSIISSIASATEETASFAKDVGGGVWDGGKSLVSGVASLGEGVLSAVQAGGRAAVDPAYRKEKMDQATALASQAADYGGRLYDDPATRKQAYEQVQAAVGGIKDQYVSARDAAEKAGKLSEFYGKIVGRGGFEAGSLLLPLTKLGALGKVGVIAEEAVDLTKVAKVGEVMKGGKAAEVVAECPLMKAAKAANKLIDSTHVPPTLANEIIATPKGLRPNPLEYLPADYVSEHLAQFENGGSRFVTKSTLEKYGIAQKDGTTFLMTNAQADEILANAGGDIGKLEDALGLPVGTLAKDELIRIDIPSPKELNLRIPSGNEAGANELWLPGGKLENGNLEAVIDVGKIPTTSYKTSTLKF